MQPPWSPGSSDSGASSQMPGVGAAQTLATQVQTLVEHVVEAERALSAREWWLLGRAIPEAHVLSELASLLSVARAELEGLLGQVAPSAPTGEADEATVSDDEQHLLNDPGWVQARCDEAVALLGQAATNLPALLEYTQQLLLLAEHAPSSSALLEGLEIARDRLTDACEAIGPPR
jgi:hypothetical protein